MGDIPRSQMSPEQLARTRQVGRESERRRREKAQTNPALYDARRQKSREYAKAWKRNNPRKVAKIKTAAHYRSSYGLTLEQRDELLVGQGGRCRICARTLEGWGKGRAGAHVDHCHKTGKVRGVLCSSCNLGLGQLQDSEGVLLAAVEYLRQYG